MKQWVNAFHARMDRWGERLHKKEMRIPVDLTVGILFFPFALGILFVLPQQVAISEKDAVNGRAFPTLLMVVMMICCAMLVGKEIYKLITKQPLTWKVINLQTELKALVILAILVVTYLLCRFTDLFVVGAIFCCLGFLAYFRCKKPSYYVITLTLTVAIWAAFRFVLNVDFYETAYIGKWHLASDGELEKKPTIDHTITAIPKQLRGGYTGFWRAADVLEFTSHGYDGYVFDENDNRLDFKGYRADCITDFALDFFDQYDGKNPFFMTISQIEPHHQNDHNHYEGPEGSKEKYKNFVLPHDLEVLKGNAAEEYPDYLGQCASLDENLGRLVARLKKEGLYDNTVIIFASDHGSHFKTRNTDSHLNGYDDYKRTCHDGALHVPLVIAGGPYKGGVAVEELVSTESLPKTILALAGVDVGDAMIGENLLDVVKKTNDNRPNQVFAQISESRVGRCVRTPDYLYSVYAPGVNGGEAAASDTYADDFLYDLNADPWQLNNVVADPAYAQAKADLRKRLLDWIEKAEGSRPTITD